MNQLIGLGWGAGFESPSSAGLMVNFTHNLFSSLWLKTGGIGVVLMFMVVFSAFHRILRTIPIQDDKKISLCLALSLCLLVNMLLYGGYKSLGFGLCLTLLISLCSHNTLQTDQDRASQ